MREKVDAGMVRISHGDKSTCSGIICTMQPQRPCAHLPTSSSPCCRIRCILFMVFTVGRQQSEREKRGDKWGRI